MNSLKSTKILVTSLICIITIVLCSCNRTSFDSHNYSTTLELVGYESGNSLAIKYPSGEQAALVPLEMATAGFPGIADTRQDNGDVQFHVFYGYNQKRLHWAVICSGPSLGFMNTNVLLSEDGGKNWSLVKAAPKELVRRGLDDGTERLRGQLRETAQRGQASDYGGDRIEDAAARGAYQARRGIESLLKKKKSAKGREQDGEIRAADPPSPQEPPADLPPPEAPTDHPSPHDPSPQERPQIKTREAVSTREGGERAGLSPGERMKRTQIKTREAAVRDDFHSDVQPAPQAGSELPQIRTRETAVRDIPADAGSAPRVRLEPSKIKMRDTCIQGQPAPAPEQPPQALVQGR